MKRAHSHPDSIDWSATTWEGARREQLQRWSLLTLEEIVRAQEEMQELAKQLARTPPPTATAGNHIGETGAPEKPGCEKEVR